MDTNEMRFLRDDKEATLIGDGNNVNHFRIRKYEDWGGVRGIARATYQRQRKELMEHLKRVIQDFEFDRKQTKAYLFGICNGMKISYNDYIEQYNPYTS